MTAAERAADLNAHICRNLGVFSPPAFNHEGDPHDKFTRGVTPNRLMPSHREGIQHAQPSALWKEVIDHEQRQMPGKTTAAPAPSPPPAVAPPPSVNTIMQPGWYYVPSLGPNGESTPALTYVPYQFAMRA